jgi:hypothetical protein
MTAIGLHRTDLPRVDPALERRLAYAEGLGQLARREKSHEVHDAGGGWSVTRETKHFRDLSKYLAEGVVLNEFSSILTDMDVLDD